MSPCQNSTKINLKNWFLDLIFPKFCFGCAMEGDWLCLACAAKIVEVRTQICPSCGRLSQSGRFCRKDQKAHGLSGIIVACYYDEGPIKELIHNFKYNHILELNDFLAGMMAESLKQNLNLGGDCLVTAVPLHFLRKAQRGYNQAEILAGKISERLNLAKNLKIIKKYRQTKPQVMTEGKKRQNNLKNCFKIDKNININNKTIILVDDVTTTGTTLNECAQVLREAGAKKVWGLVVARG